MQTTYYVEVKLIAEQHQDETGREPMTTRVQGGMTKAKFRTREQADHFYKLLLRMYPHLFKGDPRAFDSLSCCTPCRVQE